jgi:predicted nucleic acid-binding protein
MKILLDTNVYVEACRSDETRTRFRATFFPLQPATYLAAVVAYELRVNAADRPTAQLVRQWIEPMERSGRLVTPAFTDWMEAADIVTAIEAQDRSWRSKLPALLNDVLIALCARKIGATLLTHNAKDFRLIRRHKEFSLRVLAADGA